MSLAIKFRNIVTGVAIPSAIDLFLNSIFAMLYGAGIFSIGSNFIFTSGIIPVVISILVENEISKKYSSWGFGYMCIGTGLTGVVWLVGFLLGGI